MDGLVMTDTEIKEYIKTHRSTTMNDLKREVINTSPQIIDVYYEWMFDLITIITPKNKFTFFEKKEK